MSSVLDPYGFSIAIYLISIMLLIGGIVLAIGYALNEKRLKEFGKNEIFQSAVNGILIGVFLTLFAQNGLINSLIYNITTSNGVTLQCQQFLSQNAAICFAYDYLAGSGYTLMDTYHPSILSSATLILTGSIGLTAALGIIGSASLNLVVVTISFAPAINPLISQLQYLTKIFSTVAIGATVQSSILVFVAVSSTSVILPTGLLLRTFVATRKLGGFFIALAIGLYVIYPLSYLFDAYIANSYTANVNATSIRSLTVSASGFGNNIYSGIGPTVTNSVIRGITSTFITPLQLILNGFQNVITSIIDTISYFIVYTFVLPAFSLIITVISIRELSSLLGSEAFFGKFGVI
jgi:hypothetical protein